MTDHVLGSSDGGEPFDWKGLAQANRVRERAVRGSEGLVRTIRELLFEDDPIGINFGSNIDEYELEAQLIVIAMSGRSSMEVTSATRLVHQVFVEAFNADIAGSAERYRPCVEQILAVWLKDRDRS